MNSNMQAAEVIPKQDNKTGPTGVVLCVDDEQSVLNSLKRVFRRTGYQVLLANGGEDGLRILGEQDVDIVISDMRMPEMDGAEFLAQVSEKWPDVIRILLTGYADLKSSIAAINQGRIYRYLNKPWDDEEITRTVRVALEDKFLREENQRLQELANKQNEQLKEINQSLEDKVKARTVDLQKSVALIKKSHKRLTQSYHDTITMFASLIDLMEHTQTGHGHRVANFAKSIAKVQGLDEKQQQDIYFAGLLHNIGKISLASELIIKPYGSLTQEESKQLFQYPAIGQTVLTMLEPLEAIADLIRLHKERFDGKGFPGGVSGKDISISAGIVAIAVDFYEYQLGLLMGEAANANESYAFIVENSGKRYNPDLIDAFKNAFEQDHEKAQLSSELKVGIQDLKEGMVLAEDVLFKTGISLLKKGQTLTQEQIDRLYKVQSQVEGIAIHIISSQDGGAE